MESKRFQSRREDGQREDRLEKVANSGFWRFWDGICRGYA